MTLGCYGNSEVILSLMGKGLKNDIQNVLDVILLSSTLALIKMPGHSKHDSLQTKGNHLTDISYKMLPTN